MSEKKKSKKKPPTSCECRANVCRSYCTRRSETKKEKVLSRIHIHYPIEHFSSGHKYVESGKKAEEEEEEQKRKKKPRGEKRLLTGTCKKKLRTEKVTGRKERMSFTYTHTLQMDTLCLHPIFIYTPRFF